MNSFRVMGDSFCILFLFLNILPVSALGLVSLSPEAINSWEPAFLILGRDPGAR